MDTVPILETDLCPYYISIRGSESESEPMEKSCIVQESVSESESESKCSNGNKPLGCVTIHSLVEHMYLNLHP